jgi:hypothetical protein
MVPSDGQTACSNQLLRVSRTRLHQHYAAADVPFRLDLPNRTNVTGAKLFFILTRIRTASCYISCMYCVADKRRFLSACHVNEGVSMTARL